ncbi:hypothetical protein LHYA1_G002422 [Lachnellula hyalina]|uniref:Zn(2)-C6 fungal-type domain-containing protein n=1 Tax=Lachnellula hyalina TaxID=1316788 RepID=A0A8H8R5C4_9HELO|nr:uncharacterized protein LHYA1_G002422 [Lachnellula hyalina]TVY28724.1 hypothetical protein LHYA1_G002422 [Lachnellula hyalina]
MVYGGKLSKACEPCRTRRAKCDFISPECSQCLRTKRKCHGYRDTEGLRISDMSAIVVKKFKARSDEDSTNVPLPASCPDSSESGGPLAISPVLTVPIDDRAFYYFRTTFVIGNARSFRYLESLYEYGDMDDHLSVSIRAVGLASLSKAARSTDLENQAMRSYVAALRMINLAITCSNVATNDTTLSAIMLLDQFEKIIPPTARTTQAWTNHLNGATALMKMRGRHQFETKAGLEIFIQMSSHLLVSCMQHTIALPEDYLTLRTYATNFLDTNDIAWRLSQVTVRYIGFRAAIKSGSLFDTDTIIATATDMDSEMVALMGEFPPEWMPSHYDFYIDYRLAEGLNMVRAGRIPLLDLIREQCEAAPVSSGSCQEFERYQCVQRVKDNVAEMAGLICACVPQLAGYFPFLGTGSSPGSPDSYTAPGSVKDMKLELSNEASAYSLLWPLFTVANSRACPEDVKTWIIGQLRILGKLLNSEQTLEIADGLARGEERDIWSVYALLGSICYSVTGA